MWTNVRYFLYLFYSILFLIFRDYLDFNEEIILFISGSIVLFLSGRILTAWLRDFLDARAASFFYLFYDLLNLNLYFLLYLQEIYVRSLQWTRILVQLNWLFKLYLLKFQIYEIVFALFTKVWVLKLFLLLFLLEERSLVERVLHYRVLGSEIERKSARRLLDWREVLLRFFWVSLSIRLSPLVDRRVFFDHFFFLLVHNMFESYRVYSLDLDRLDVLQRVKLSPLY